MKISRRRFWQMLAALPIVSALPLPLPEVNRVVWASGVEDFTIAGFGTPKAYVIIPNGIRINWGVILRQNPEMTARFCDGVDGVVHVWGNGKWSDGTPEILVDYEVVGEDRDLRAPMLMIG